MRLSHAMYHVQPHVDETHGQDWWIGHLGTAEMPAWPTHDHAIRRFEDLKVLGCLTHTGESDLFVLDRERLGVVIAEHKAVMDGLSKIDDDVAPISMIITTNGRADLLLPTLQRLHSLTTPDEIILVDDGTPDDSVLRVVEQARHWDPPLPIKYVYNDHPGMTNCCHARNVALRMCSHEDVLTTEPECWYVSDVVPLLMAAREDHPREILSAERCYFSEHPWHTLNLDNCMVAPAWPYLNLWRRDLLTEIGGWDEELPGPWGWDDSDLQNRFLHLDEPVQQYFVPGIYVHHMWHPSRIEPAVENERHVRAKEFPRDVVANRDGRWGTIKT